MSRTPSRLHMLERGLKKPRKSAAKSTARALTVMRFEGASAARATAHVPARLPREIEDQIDVVRGRAVAKPSRGLLQLEKRLLGVQEAEPAAPAIQRYDHRAPPRAAPAAPAFTPTPAPPVAQASAFSAPSPFAGSAFSGRFNVESFEDTSSAPPVLAPRQDTSAVAVPAVPWQERQFIAPTGAAPGAGSAPWAAEPYSVRPMHKNLTREQQEVAAGFERDLAAMLGPAAAAPTAPEDKQWDDTLRTVAQPAQPPNTAVAPQPIPAPTPAPKPDAHEVFNQMGLAMNYANSFDLGAVNLSARFDQFERELATGPTPAPPAAAPVPVRALELDEFDLVADLTELSGAQSTVPEKESRPAEPGPTP